MFIRGKRQKNQKGKGLQILKMRVQDFFTHGEGISTLNAHHKGRQPLIECAKHDFKIMYFPFLYFYVFSLFIFFTFWGRQGCCHCSYISSCAMRKSDLCSSLSLKVLCVTLILCFFFFERLIYYEQKSFKVLNLETMF